MLSRHLAKFFAAVLCALAAAADSSAIAQAQPVCSGKDMLEELKASDATSYADVRAAAEATTNARSMFWRIEAEGVAPSYLFGTVHLTDDRVNALPAPVRSALNDAKRLALEVADVSPESFAKAMGGLRDIVMFADGGALDRIISAGELGLVRTAMGEMGVPPEAVPLFRPWFVTLSLALTSCERRRAATGLRALDVRLGEAVKARGAPVIGLETLESQMRAFAAVPEPDQLAMLKVSLKYYDRADDLMETMVRQYLARDIGSIWPLQMALAKQAGFSPEAFKSFEQNVIVLRNAQMRDAALPLLREGGSFIAVGALHLPGQHGLVELFRGAGYKVVPAE